MTATAPKPRYTSQGKITGKTDAPLVLIWDGGNSLNKGTLIYFTTTGEPVRVLPICFPHRLIPLAPGEWSRITKRERRGKGVGMGNRSYFEVDNFYHSDYNAGAYVVGEAAELAGVFHPRIGMDKYYRDYYGVLMLGTLIRFLSESHNNITIFCSRPPVDVEFEDEQIESIAGKFKVIASGGQTLKIGIRQVIVADEPLGGYANMTLGLDGRAYTDHGFDGGRTLMFDVGGGMMSVLSIDRHSQPEYNVAASVAEGINRVTDRLATEIRANDEHKRVLADQRILPPETLRDAIRTGKYRHGDSELDVTDEVNRAVNPLLNAANTLLRDAGGIGFYRRVGITGGGGAAVELRLTDEVIKNPGMTRLSEQNRALMHFANMNGLEKLFFGMYYTGRIELPGINRR